MLYSTCFRKQLCFANVFIIACIAIFTFAVPQQVQAQRDGFGVGIVVGEPTGLSFKKFVNRTNAFQAGVAWSFHRENRIPPFSGPQRGFFYFHLDYLKHFYLTSSSSAVQIPVYVGVGGFAVMRNDDPILGLRIPFGIAVHFGSFPMDVFLEAVPTLSLVPGTNFYGGVAAGLRFYL